MQRPIGWRCLPRLGVFFPEKPFKPPPPWELRRSEEEHPDRSGSARRSLAFRRRGASLLEPDVTQIPPAFPPKSLYFSIFFPKLTLRAR